MPGTSGLALNVLPFQAPTSAFPGAIHRRVLRFVDGRDDPHRPAGTPRSAPTRRRKP